MTYEVFLIIFLGILCWLFAMLLTAKSFRIQHLEEDLESANRIKDHYRRKLVLHGIDPAEDNWKL